MLWMAFFGRLHDPHASAVLDAATDCPEFERFFADHMRKLLWVRRRPRYLSKANYNVTRMEYLLKLRSEEHTSELQSLMRNSYTVFCLKKTKNNKIVTPNVGTHI